MARLPRLVVPEHPHHVVQRGNNGQAIVLDDEDRREWLRLLGDAASTHGLAVHAYALLDDHFRLLATPKDSTSLSATMQSLGRRYVSGFNRRHGRTGTLWEGRFRGGLLEAGSHLLSCMQFIELSPVLKGVASGAVEFPWSSAAHHLGQRRDLLVADHPLYWALGNTPFERQAAYRKRLEQGLPAAEMEALEQSARQGWPLGTQAFLKTLASAANRPLTPRPRGRPPRASAVAEVQLSRKNS
jgi:putative transposase